MAVSDWSTDTKQNIALGGFKLNGEYGMMFAEMMAQIKSAFDAMETEVEGAVGEWTAATPARTTTAKAAIEALEGKVGAWTTAEPARTDTVCEAVETIESGIGVWTDETEDTTVKAAIEALRPSGD